MKIHDEIDDWSAGALCGVLTPGEKQEFEQHLAECPRCRSLHEEDRKMNETLKETLSADRPDADFEQRVIERVRGKIRRPWFNPWIELHPLRGLVWPMQFRVAQAAVALLVLAAMVAGMVVGGALISGERLPWQKTPEIAYVQKLPSSAGARGIQDAVFSGNQLQLGNPTAAAVVSSLTLSGKSIMYTVASGAPQEKTGYWNGSEAGQGSWNTFVSGGNNTNWATNTYWGDTMAKDVGGAGAPGIAGTLSIGDTTTFNVASSGSVSLNGNNTTIGSISGAGNVVMNGAGTQVLTGSEIYTGRTTIASGATLQLPADSSKHSGYFGGGNGVEGKDDVNGISVTGGNPNANLAASGNFLIGATGSNSTMLTSHSDDNVHTRVMVNNTQTAAGSSAGNSGPANVASGTGTIISGAQAALPPIIDTRKLIRTASLDFEVPAFDKAVQTISNIATEERGYIFTQNSGKAANGKLQGELVVKVTPANLDRFLLRMRDVGEIKNETVSAQDVSKDYYDTESRMRNAQITEERMIDILKKKTGDVADLLEVEKQIADVRGEIEQMQGQLKYYDGLVQFATVTITLAEKGDVDQNAAWVLTQQAQLSLFSHDVEQAFTAAKNAASAANAQTLESHMERDVDGREVATLHLLLPPENSEDAIAKMKSIGRIQTFTTQTQRVARNNAGPDTAKIEHDKVELNLVIQHDAENPVQGTNIGVLTEDVEDKANQIKTQAAAAGAEVKNADFNRAQNGAELASMLLRLPMKNYPAFIEKIKLLGQVKDFTVTRRETSNATEDAPAEIALQIYNQAAANMRNAEPVAPKITVHGTVNESSSALMWSLRMIGVSLAFLAPWAVIAGIAFWVVALRRRVARKS